ncbi:MAG: hypothetical protein WAP03_18780 [Methylorubrum rhodinum]|uniref:hypothetical protein n=1 Tax=Methylorubrum rhodinum TaxID=29428 RepID=UPI003BB0FA21
MSNRSQSWADTVIAEIHIREAMTGASPTAQCDAVMLAYWHTPAEKRDAFVAVLAARLTLVPPSSTSPAGAAA